MSLPTWPPPTDRPKLEGEQEAFKRRVVESPTRAVRLPDAPGHRRFVHGATGTLLSAALAAQCHARIHVLNVVDTSPARIPPPLDMALLAADAVAGEILHKRR